MISFILSVILNEYSTLILGIVIIFGIILMFCEKINPITNVFLAFVFKGELYTFIILLFCIIFIMLKRNWNTKVYIKKWFFFSVIALSINSLISAFHSQTLINIVLYMGYLSILILTYYSFKNQFTFEEIYLECKKYIKLEFIVTFMLFLKCGNLEPSDYYCGTFGNAHFLGIWLLFCLIVIFRYNTCELNMRTASIIRKEFWCISLNLVMLYLADAKHIDAVFVASIFVYIFVKRFVNKNKQILVVGLVLTGAIYIVVNVLQVSMVKNYIRTKSDYVYTYLYNDDFNYKYNYYYGTLNKQLTGVHMLIGYGFGQYGSRIANMCGYESMHKENTQLNKIIEEYIPSNIIPEYEIYASQYSEYIASIIQWRSAVLTYPFNSFIALIAENGILGLGLWFYIFNRLSKRSKCSFLTIFILNLFLFDMYFDYIFCIGFYILIISNTFYVNKKNIMNLVKSDDEMIDSESYLTGELNGN